MKQSTQASDMTSGLDGAILGGIRSNPSKIFGIDSKGIDFYLQIFNWVDADVRWSCTHFGYAVVMSSSIPYLGSKISLISKAEIRYEGILYTIDPNESTVALAKGLSVYPSAFHTDEQILCWN